MYKSGEYHKRSGIDSLFKMVELHTLQITVFNSKSLLYILKALKKLEKYFCVYIFQIHP